MNITVCKCRRLSVFQWSTNYWFSVATVASSLCCQMLNSSVSRSSQFPLFILLWVVFHLSPSHFSHRPPVILHAQYVCIPFQHVVFHVLWVTNNFVLVTCIFFLKTTSFFRSMEVLTDLQIRIFLVIPSRTQAYSLKMQSYYHLDIIYYQLG
jgi:hypothetical protein